MDTATIKFNLDHYNPKNLGQNDIFVLSNKICNCDSLILSVDLNNLIIGQPYTISYKSINNSNIVIDPSGQVINAASVSQKFSTIIKNIDTIKSNIIQADISGLNISASQMCIIKCDQIDNCAISTNYDIVLNNRNNWTYSVGNIKIAQFKPYENNAITQITIKNTSPLPDANSLIGLYSPIIYTSSSITGHGVLYYLSKFERYSGLFKLANSSTPTNKNITPGVLSI